MRSSALFPVDTYEKLFHSFMQISEDAVFLVDHELKVLQANSRASAAYKIPQDKLVGSDFKLLSAEQDRNTLEQICTGMGENARWKGKLSGLDAQGDTFPIELSISRLGDDQVHCCVVVRDLRAQAALSENLQHEKSHRREMYITLRNVMSSVEKEKIGLERLVAHKIETLLLPALDKAKREPDRDIQSGYLDFIRAQLLGLTKTFPRELDIGFVRLTRSEMKICQYLQAGYSSKEIADALNIAFETIQTHRKNIRRKLGLHGKKISLYSFLSTRRKLGDISKP